MRIVRTALAGGLVLLATASVLALASPAGADVLTGATSASSRFGTTCAVTTARQVRCWGNNSRGQLGDGTTTNRPTAVLVRAVSGPGALGGVAQVAVGSEHTCARLTNGRAACWGRNDDGQLGDGTEVDRTRPVLVRNGADTGVLTGVGQLSAGTDHTCARLTDGRAACWGGNLHGQSGNGTSVDHELPTLVLAADGSEPLRQVAQVVAGRAMTCARRAGGQVRCWGENGLGQLGDGTQVDRWLPRPVVGPLGAGRLTGVDQLATADQHTCARLTVGQARCWGWGNEGELGTGDGLNSTTPVTPELPNGQPLVNVAQVAVGSNHSCFRFENGRVRCSGYGGNLQLGNPDGADEQLSPLLVRGAGGSGPLGGVLQLALGNTHTCVRLVGGLVGCWGQNFFGQLGNGDGLDHPSPVAVHR
jgi:alpha-tubulin suppressor-like RCC1 family protein